MANFSLQIGLNDKESHRQEFNTDYYVKTIGNYVDACTIIPCVGYYKGERENSLRVEIYDTTREHVEYLCNEFKAIFNQESIILNELSLNPIFI